MQTKMAGDQELTQVVMMKDRPREKFREENMIGLAICCQKGKGDKNGRSVPGICHGNRDNGHFLTSRFVPTDPEDN